MTRQKSAYACSALAAAFLVAGCATQPDVGTPPTTKTLPNRGTSGVSVALADAAERAQKPGLPTAEERARLFKGTGVLVKGQQPGGALPSGPVVVQQGGGGVVLNFEAADLREVVRNILGDVLNESYTIDASVGGQVTIRTSAGIPRDALIPTLETLLRMNGATMVKEDGIWKILPSAAAVRGNVTPQLGNSQRALPSGFSVQIVPLRYIGVREMLRILEPFVKDPTAARPDDLRNLLILSGSERELKHLLETIDTFDVDWMAGNVGRPVHARERRCEIGDRGSRQGDWRPQHGSARGNPADHSARAAERVPHHHAAARVSRRGEEMGGAARSAGLWRRPALLRLHAAKHARREARAAAAAGVLGTPAGARAAGRADGRAGNARGHDRVAAAVPAAARDDSAAGGDPGPAAADHAATGPGAAAAGTGIVRNIQVVADKDNNTLLLVATPAEYAVIEAAVKKMDVPSRQVMMEVTIATVL